jgi:hypothetical protein
LYIKSFWIATTQFQLATIRQLCSFCHFPLFLLDFDKKNLQKMHSYIKKEVQKKLDRYTCQIIQCNFVTQHSHNMLIHLSTIHLKDEKLTSPCLYTTDCSHKANFKTSYIWSSLQPTKRQVWFIYLLKHNQKVMYISN